MVHAPEKTQAPDIHLMSLDFFRGVTMLFLIAETAGIYELLFAPSFKGTMIYTIGTQFQHQPWKGLHLWDLGQPFFMFISGVAMAFSYGKRWESGASWAATFRHALWRSLLLFLFGWAIYQIDPVEGGSYGAFLYDMLPQLSFACLLAFLMMRCSLPKQFFFTSGLLVLTEVLYRLWAVPGFNQPHVPGHNFGSYIDMMLMGKLSDGHWVAFNAVPLACLTIWGVMSGQILRSRRVSARKVSILAMAGLIGVVAGLALSLVTPIIRRISTTSFVVVAGGLCLLALAISYWLIDVMKFRTWAKFFAIVGMNPLFIYLFTQTGGGEWFQQIVAPFSRGLVGWAGAWPAQAATSLGVLALFWSLCYWLYKRRIFIRI
jgi:predicted acyltransferase